MTQRTSRGAALASRLETAVRQAEQAPRVGARTLPVVPGVTRECVSANLENTLQAISDILANSGRVYNYGNTVSLEVGDGEQKRLRPLLTDNICEKPAPALLANLFVCQTPATNNQAGRQFPPTKTIVETALGREPTREGLPTVLTYARRPVLDDDFVPLNPGWHPEQQTLVHGFVVEPVMPERVAAETSVKDRLPSNLQRLLGDFCFRTDVDLVNGVAAFLTGVLANHFVDAGKPVLLLDGTQPGLGKSLFAQCLGMVLDGEETELIQYTADDEELGKKICATLRGNQQSIVLIDNAKVKSGGSISSPVLEANTVAPQISLRILGLSANYRRPNDLVWAITMNDTRSDPDLVSRGLPIRFHYEGDAGARDFGGRDPKQFARQHRQEILGELIGLVQHWNQQGRPHGSRPHRLTKWAEIIGGILQANGFDGFLDNLAEAAAEFNPELDELAALAEAALKTPPSDFWTDGSSIDGRPAKEWDRLFRTAGVLPDKLAAAKSDRSKSTIIGNWLSRNLGRPVPIQIGEPWGRVELCKVEGRAREKRYFLRFHWEATENDPKVVNLGLNGEPQKRGSPPRSTRLSD